MPNWIASIELGQVLIAGTFVIAMSASIQKLISKMAPVFRLMDDLIGTPAEFGKPARPGILERMDKVEREMKGQRDILTSQSNILEDIQRKVTRNENAR